MPSVRRSTGRAVTPVRQPEVASAKQTKMYPPPMAAFPQPPGLTIEADGEFASLPALLTAAPPRPVPVEHVEPPLLVEMPPVLKPESDIEDMTAPFDEPPPLDVNWVGGVQAVSAEAEGLRFLAGLRPRLAAGMIEQEAVLASFPTAVRLDQQDALRRLVEESDLVLVADPGCGMVSVAALGLRELFRLGRIQRALVLTSPETLRAWSQAIALWAQELRLAVGPGERSGVWPGEAEVWIVEPRLIAEALRSSLAAPAALACGVVLLAGYTAMRRRGFDPTSLAALPTPRRWVMTGGPPPEAEDWRLLHRYLHPDWAGPAALADIQERLRDQTIRQTKAAVQSELPRRARNELWFELVGEQRAAYQLALEEERLRLERLGGAINRTHLSAALGRLKRILAFQPGTLDGVKVRALIDLSEEILASGSKLVVVSPPDAETMPALVSVLEAYGAVRLDSAASAESQSAAIAEFRGHPARRVLVADSEARGDGEPFNEATYVIHFSHDWNPAHRRRVEQRLYPDLGPGPALTLYEFWAAGTVEERYHRLLESQGLLARDVALETRPKDIEERLTLQDWMREVFEVGADESVARAGRAGGTGQLPGTGDLRKAWAGFDVEGLATAAESLLRALGFTQLERVRPADETGCDFQAWATLAAGAEQVFIRLLRLDAPGEVDEGEAILDELKDRPDCVGAYLIATVEFTPACRRLAEGSDGRLVLVDGSEFLRHLRVLGLVA